MDLRSPQKYPVLSKHQPSPKARLTYLSPQSGPCIIYMNPSYHQGLINSPALPKPTEFFSHLHWFELDELRLSKGIAIVKELTSSQMPFSWMQVDQVLSPCEGFMTYTTSGQCRWAVPFKTAFFCSVRWNKMTTAYLLAVDSLLWHVFSVKPNLAKASHPEHWTGPITFNSLLSLKNDGASKRFLEATSFSFPYQSWVSGYHSQSLGVVRLLGRTHCHARSFSPDLCCLTKQRVGMLWQQERKGFIAVMVKGNALQNTSSNLSAALPQWLIP